MSLNLSLGALRTADGLASYGQWPGSLLRAGDGQRDRGLSPDATADVFGADIVRRAVAPAQSTATQGADSGEGASGGNDVAATQDAERSALAGALADSVRWMATNHGDAAATAIMGIVYKRVGDGPVTEDALGNGLLDAVRFVDRQFGTTAGDAFMAKLNGDGGAAGTSLNDALNKYFDNGLNERFMVAGSGNLAAMAVQQAEAAKATLTQRADSGEDGGDGAADPLKSLLDMLRKMNAEDGASGASGATGTTGATATTAASGGTAGVTTGVTASGAAEGTAEGAATVQPAIMSAGSAMQGLLSGAAASLAGAARSGLAATYGPTGAAAHDPASLAPGLLLQASA